MINKWSDGGKLLILLRRVESYQCSYFAFYFANEHFRLLQFSSLPLGVIALGIRIPGRLPFWTLPTPMTLFDLHLHD